MERKDCPVCGKRFKNLGRHMSAKHKDWEYKQEESSVQTEPAVQSGTTSEPETFEVKVGDVFAIPDGKTAIAIKRAGEEVAFSITQHITPTLATPYHKLLENVKSIKLRLIEHNILNGIWKYVNNVADIWRP